MILKIPAVILSQIHAHGESAYPEEGAGFLVGRVEGEQRRVIAILSLENAREDGARHNRYLITPQDVLHGEREAERQGLELLGVYHSHPDHPSRPSAFDREWALPWFSYVITTVNNGRAKESRSWRLADDRSQFLEEPITVLEAEPSSD